ncbi:unnamed protein product [Rhizophagus irregularis]|nr:unnamed protein product [Rhizophagus irregularis]
MVSFDRFIDIKEIDEGAIWINNKSKLLKIHWNTFKEYGLTFGLRPEFGKGTSECYKKLAYKRMNSNSIERPPAKGLK